ncbi:hypothetical protein G9A89_012715 [Geosiphon pyriformis]|nr:hypothetical protein G9A89_012715 [Geosiphon pyriformis]
MSTIEWQNLLYWSHKQVLKYRQGKIATKTSPSGTLRYLSFFQTTQNAPTTTSTEKGYLYAKQKKDLGRQKLLLCRYLTYKLLSDLGTVLETLLEREGREVVSEVLITRRDRLCCSVFDLLQYLFPPFCRTHGSLWRGNLQRVRTFLLSTLPSGAEYKDVKTKTREGFRCIPTILRSSF